MILRPKAKQLIVFIKAAHIPDYKLCIFFNVADVLNVFTHQAHPSHQTHLSHLIL